MSLKTIHFLILLLGFSLAAGCSPSLPNPLSAPKTERDLKRLEVAESRLTYRPKSLLILPSPLEGEEAKALFYFSASLFKAQAGLTPIDRNLLLKLIKRSENKDFNPRNLVQSIALAENLSADYLLLMRKTLLKGKEATYLQLIDPVSTERLFEATLPWPPKGSSKLERRLQEKFPLLGVILETRGSGQFAKISLGKSFGVKVGRSFIVKIKPQGTEQKALARGKVVQVKENDSWLEIDREDREQIMIGQEAQSRPKRSWLF